MSYRVVFSLLGLLLGCSSRSAEPAAPEPASQILGIQLHARGQRPAMEIAARLEPDHPQVHTQVVEQLASLVDAAYSECDSVISQGSAKVGLYGFSVRVKKGSITAIESASPITLKKCLEVSLVGKVLAQAPLESTLAVQIRPWFASASTKASP